MGEYVPYEIPIIIEKFKITIVITLVKFQGGKSVIATENGITAESIVESLRAKAIFSQLSNS
jgi:hypothetical protein